MTLDDVKHECKKIIREAEKLSRKDHPYHIDGNEVNAGIVAGIAGIISMMLSQVKPILDLHQWKWLPEAEIDVARVREDRDRLIIGGVVKFNTIIFMTADFSVINVPKTFFSVSGDGTRPNFSRMKITDFGHTVSFGKYEAASSHIIELHGGWNSPDINPDDNGTYDIWFRNSDGVAEFAKGSYYNNLQMWDRTDVLAWRVPPIVEEPSWLWKVY